MCLQPKGTSDGVDAKSDSHAGSLDSLTRKLGAAPHGVPTKIDICKHCKLNSCAAEARPSGQVTTVCVFPKDFHPCFLGPWAK